MSVSQVKKKFEEMSQYLNRDAEGQKRLRELKDAVNVLRTSLATAVEEKQRAEAIKDQARARADKAVTELDAMLVEVQSLRSTIETLRGENARLMAEMDKATTPQEREDEDFFSRLKPDTPGRLIYELRKVLPHCPYFRRQDKIDGRVGHIFLDDYFTEFSHQEFWAFGASVFILTMLCRDVGKINGGSMKGLLISIRGGINTVNLGGILKDDRHKRMFGWWFQKNCYDDKKHTTEENIQFTFSRHMNGQFRDPRTITNDSSSEIIFGSDDDED